MRTEATYHVCSSLGWLAHTDYKCVDYKWVASIDDATIFSRQGAHRWRHELNAQGADCIVYSYNNGKIRVSNKEN
jgi:hypothetical protein